MLRTFALRLATDATATLTFLVYQADSLTGPYQHLGKMAKQVASATSLTPAASPSLEIPLSAGKYYLLGVSVPSAHRFGTILGSTPVPLSFGQALGSFNFSDATLPAPPSVQIGINELDSGISMTIISARSE
jgi:hypothetical protein